MSAILTAAEESANSLNIAIRGLGDLFCFYFHFIYMDDIFNQILKYQIKIKAKAKMRK
jgi:hypothetical protein